MNIFLRKLALFLLILLAYLGLNCIINKVIFDQSNVPVKNVDVLIDGDSHIKYSLDPKLFYSAQNISQTAEPYIVTYLKLKFLFQKIKIDTLIVGFSHHNLSAFNDLKFSNEFWSSEMFSRIYPIYNYDYMKGMPVDINEFYRAYFRNMSLYPKTNHYNFIGKYSNRPDNDISDFNEAIDRHFKLNGKEIGASETSLSCLDSIIQLCKKKDVTLILIGTPVHREYYKRIPPFFKEIYDKEKRHLKDQDVFVIDLTKKPYEDKYFLDSNHLNEKGADIFTREIISILENNNLNRKISNAEVSNSND